MMKINCRTLFLLWLLIAPLIAIGAAHPIWWWDCNSGDLIVRGKIEYEDVPTIEVKHEYKGNTLTTYYITGKLKISDVLYLNPNSRYPDSYKNYLNNLKSEFDVLLQAKKRPVLGRTKERNKFVPFFPSSIPQDEAIIVLNMEYVYPIGDLVLKAVIPKDREDEVAQIIHKRNQRHGDQEINLYILISIWVLIIMVCFVLINIRRIKRKSESVN